MAVGHKSNGRCNLWPCQFNEPPPLLLLSHHDPLLLLLLLLWSPTWVRELIKFAEKCNPANRQWQQLFLQPFFISLGSLECLGPAGVVASWLMWHLAAADRISKPSGWCNWTHDTASCMESWPELWSRVARVARVSSRIEINLGRNNVT